MSKTFEILEWNLWDGKITDEQFELFARMRNIVDDMNRPDDPVIYSWYEHTQWKWKQCEYAWVLSHLKIPLVKKKVLDAGCGYTPLIRYLASIGMDAYGFDWDVMSDIQKKASRLLNGDLVKYHKQDIRAMNWQSDFFDYSVSVSVLEHLIGTLSYLKKALNTLFPRKYKLFLLDNIRSALGELIRVTKPGGLIILTMDRGYGGGIPVRYVEKLFDITIDDFPGIETIRSYWQRDEYYSHKNKIYPGTPREYTAFLIVLRKDHAQ